MSVQSTLLIKGIPLGTSSEEVLNHFLQDTKSLIHLLEEVIDEYPDSDGELKYRLFNAIQVSDFSQYFEQIKEIEGVLRNQGVFSGKPCPPLLLASESPYWRAKLTWPTTEESTNSEQLIEEIAKEYMSLGNEEREEYISKIDQLAVLLSLLELADFWQVQDLKQSCLESLEELDPSTLKKYVADLSDTQLTVLRIISQQERLEEFEVICFKEEMSRKGMAHAVTTFYDLGNNRYSTSAQFFWQTQNESTLQILQQYPRMDHKVILNEEAILEISNFVNTTPSLPFKWIQFVSPPVGGYQRVSQGMWNKVLSHFPQLKTVEIPPESFEKLFSENTWEHDCLISFKELNQSPIELIIGVHKRWNKPVKISPLEGILKKSTNDSEESMIQKLKFLKNAGVIIDFLDINRNGPLHCCRGVKLLRYLLDTGFDPNKENMFGSSPFHTITRFQPEKMIAMGNLLLKYGGRVDLENKSGCQPLHTLIKEKWLLKTGGVLSLQWFLDQDAEVLSGTLVNALDLICKHGPEHPSEELKEQILRMKTSLATSFLKEKDRERLDSWFD